MRVLVATDFSEGSALALREAASLASSPDDVIAVVHVMLRLQHESLLFAARDAAIEAHAVRIAGRSSAALRDQVRSLLPSATETFLDEGTDYAEIVRRAERWRADLVIVGSHGHSRIRHVLGDVAMKVVRYAHCPVLVARASAGRGWVLAATDLSDPSLPAISAGAVEARRRGAKLKVVHSVGFLDIEAAYLVELGTPSIPDGSSEREALADALGKAVTRSGADATCALIDAPAAAAIVHEADALGAELIVVGTRGKTGLARLVLGNVAEKVVRAASCSVLVVRQNEL